MKYLLLITFFLTGIGAQKAMGQTIVEDPGVTSMMRSYVSYNKQNTKMRGWRVQLVATTDKRQMETARRKFENRYPEYELMFNHEPPFFHLQTGAFLTKKDALPFMQRMKKSFSGAFLVADEIEVYELMNYE